MTIGSISFWQQDQAFWSRSAQRSQAQEQSAALINVIGNAMTTLSSGLASIANQTALNRVNSQLSAAVQSALASITGGSSSSPSSTAGASTSSSTSSSASGSSTAPPAPPPKPLPATGTGTASLAANTPLLTLGILAGGSISITAGTNTTTYKSTGHDAVGDLINAINTSAATKANVTASLDPNGRLVITSNNTTDSITISGIYAGNIGFGPGNTTFTPTKPPASAPAAPSTSTTSSATSSSGSSSTGTSTSGTARRTPSSGIPTNSSTALLTGGTAEILLASNGLSGNIVNLLA